MLTIHYVLHKVYHVKTFITIYALELVNKKIHHVKLFFSDDKH